jgi:hypothetical protein
MTWTNASIRAHLGEHGFLSAGAPITNYDLGVTYTSFMRGNDELVLVEYANGQEPTVVQDGVEVDVTNIGWRNEQIQHDKLRGD